jgi:transcription initiation factor IIE alpha subunit
MGYLICKKCGGYYELQPGEQPEDFTECQCGGELTYKENLTGKRDKLPSITSIASKNRDKSQSNKKNHSFPSY